MEKDEKKQETVVAETVNSEEQSERQYFDEIGVIPSNYLLVNEGKHLMMKCTDNKLNVLTAFCKVEGKGTYTKPPLFHPTVVRPWLMNDGSLGYAFNVDFHMES